MPNFIVQSIIKGLFTWNWQNATLVRGDELVNLPLAYMQPYKMLLVDTTFSSGRVMSSTRRMFGIMSLYYDKKTSRPDVSPFFLCTSIG
jgi:hypothetical protein